MASPKQHYDQNASPIPVLRPGAIVNDAVGGASTSSALPSGASIVEISANTGVWILFGGSGVTVSTSTGMFLGSGSAAAYIIPDGATHIAYIQDSASGRISITELH